MPRCGMSRSLWSMSLAGSRGPGPRRRLPAGSENGSNGRARSSSATRYGLVREATQGTAQTPEIKTEMYYSATVPTLIDMSKGAEMIVVGRRGHSACR